MIGEVAAVLSALKALNEGLSTLKESAGHSKSLQGLVGKWGEASEKYRDVEKAKAGKMSYKEALAMESAKRQLENFDRQFKDICLLQGHNPNIWASGEGESLSSASGDGYSVATPFFFCGKTLEKRRRKIVFVICGLEW